MSEPYQFLAIDLGAESGRAELVTLREGKAQIEEVHHFPNRKVLMAGTLYWDFPGLFAEVLASLRICGIRGIKLNSVGVDTWGVDFGLLDKDGKLLSNPVCYRDGRTKDIHQYSSRFMSNDEIFAITAYEPWAISSLFQLLSLQRDGSGLLEAADTFLNIPDLFNYFLSGVKRSELSILNTSNLMDTQCRWAQDVIKAFSLPRGMFHELIAPGAVLGGLTGEVAGQTSLSGVPVIATCGHDTSAAVAAVPGEGDNWAFLSCGTWSILGALIKEPITTPQCIERGFTNEYTLGRWYLARNILGLWLLQELRRKWDTSGDPWDYVRMTTEATEATGVLLIDAADDSLMAPSDMEDALLALIKKTGQPVPVSRGELVRGVLESLALEYAHHLDSMAELTGRRSDALYMVGGGINNALLCQFAANACGVVVHAGCDQCTALGNALVQGLAIGALASPQEIRDVVRDSFPLTTYEPQDEGFWGDRRQAYEMLKN